MTSSTSTLICLFHVGFADKIFQSILKHIRITIPEKKISSEYEGVVRISIKCTGLKIMIFFMTSANSRLICLIYSMHIFFMESLNQY